MSSLVEHAEHELALVGEEPDVIEGYLKVIQAFADMGHSGGSASVAIPVIHQLLNHRPLTALTNDPAEWIHREKTMWNSVDGIWQNKRNSEAFSTDGGKTYYLIFERGKKLYTSEEKQS